MRRPTRGAVAITVVASLLVGLALRAYHCEWKKGGQTGLTPLSR